MTHTAKRSINRKLTLTATLTTWASLLLTCLVFVAYDVITVRRAMIREAATLATVIGINSAVALTFDDPAAAAETLGALSAAVPILAAVVYDRDGNAFAQYASDAAFAPQPVEPAGQHFHGDYLDLFREIVFQGSVVGSIHIRSDTKELTTRIERYAAIVLTLFVAAAAAAALISSRLRRQISAPLTDLVQGSEAIAAGDLSARVVESTEDEIGVLARTFNAMALGLRDLVVQVRQSIGDVSEVSVALQESSGSMSLEAQRQKAAIAETTESVEQVSASSHEVNANVEEVANSARDSSSSILEMDTSISEVSGHMDHLSESIDTTSSAVNELVANINQVVEGVETLQTATVGALSLLHQLAISVRQVKDNAEESHALSDDTRQEASKGMQAVNETISAMREISSSFRQLEQSVSRLAKKSQSIDEIIQVIGEVAEQTSLLSLNASIIAAQAGEHGKPFAVVAEQVKSLASRTHRSAQEIATLIRAVQDDTAAAVTAVEEGSARVEKGVQRSNVAGEVLSKIGQKSEVSTSRVHEIADATARQSDDLELVDQAMLEVREIVEHIDRSGREQLRATTEIANTVLNIRALGAGVRTSTDEQERGSRLITGAVTTMAERIDQIAESTQAQTKSTETIHQALQVFRDVTDETTRRAEAIRAMVTTLSEHSHQLEREIGRFKTE